jgi:hypothetical protein
MGEGASTLLSLPDGRASSSIFLWGRNATKAGLATSRTKAIAIPTTTIPGSFVGGIFRVLESLDWNWRSIERVAGSDRVTPSITPLSNVQCITNLRQVRDISRGNCLISRQFFCIIAGMPPPPKVLP